jgi:hypothetical protein
VTADRGYGEARVDNELRDIGVKTVVLRTHLLVAIIVIWSFRTDDAGRRTHWLC